MGSFKFRLVTYFVLLALLPVAAASWAFIQVAARGEKDRVDSRLNAALRVAVANFADQVSEAAERATDLAETPSVQLAFAERDEKALTDIGRSVHRAVFYAGSHVVGQPPVGPAAERATVVVSADGRRVGRIVIWIPLDDTLVRRLRATAGLETADRLLLLSGGEVIAGASTFEGPVSRPSEQASYIELGGEDYRAVSTDLLSGDEAVGLVALTPKAELDDAVRDLRNRLIFFALGALAFVGLLAYAFGRPIVRSLRELSDAARAVAQGHFERRVRVRGHDEFALLTRAFNDMASELEVRLEELAKERARVRNAIERFGSALSATHDVHKLLPIIVESAVEATGAAGGRLLQNEREVAAAGEPSPAKEPLEVPVGEKGSSVRLLLYPKGNSLSNDARDLARTLAGQAAIALENARLHRRVKRQAVTDGLTELANRRQFEDALAGEISRVARFGGPLTLILADLDDFKATNDRHGHLAGDDVLRAFADVLRSNVREIDVAARYGGEEFAVLLPQTDLDGAEHLAERIREEFASEQVDTAAGSIAATASFGVASYPAAPTADALLASADEALYRAKQGGKNRVVVADDGVALHGSH